MSRLSSARATLAAAARAAAVERTPWGGSLLRGTLGLNSGRHEATTATTAKATARGGQAQPALGVHARSAGIAGSYPAVAAGVGLYVHRRVTASVSPPSYPRLSLFAPFSYQSGSEIKARILMTGRLAASTNMQELFSAVQEGHRDFNAANSTVAWNKLAELARTMDGAKRASEGKDILNTVRLLTADLEASATPSANLISAETSAQDTLRTARETHAESRIAYDGDDQQEPIGPTQAVKKKASHVPGQTHLRTHLRTHQTESIRSTRDLAQALLDSAKLGPKGKHVNLAAVQEMSKEAVFMANRMDAHDLSTGLRALGQLAVSGMDVDAAAVRALSKEVSRASRTMKPRHLRHTLWAINELTEKGFAVEVDVAVLRATCTRMERRVKRENSLKMYLGTSVEPTAVREVNKGLALRTIAMPPKVQNITSMVLESHTDFGPTDAALALRKLAKSVSTNKRMITRDDHVATLQLAMKAAERMASEMAPSDVQMTLQAFQMLALYGTHLDAASVQAVISASVRVAAEMEFKTASVTLHAFANLAKEGVDVDAAAVRAISREAVVDAQINRKQVTQHVSFIAKLAAMRMEVDAAAVQEAITAVLPMATQLSASDLATVSRALAMISDSGVEVNAVAVQAVSKEASRMANEMIPEHLTTILLALGRLTEKGFDVKADAAVLQAVSNTPIAARTTPWHKKVQKLLSDMRESHLDLNPTDAAHTLYQLATYLLGSIYDDTTTSTQTFSSFIILSDGDVATLQLAVKAAERTANKMNARDISIVMSVFRSMMIKKMRIDEAAVRAVVDEVVRVADGMNSTEVFNTMQTVAQLAAQGFDFDVATIQAVSNATQRSASEMNRYEVSKTLWAVAMLAEKGVDVHAALVRAVCTRAVRVADYYMSSQDANMSVQAIAKLTEKGIDVDAVAVQAVSNAAARFVDNLNPCDTSLLSCTMAKLAAIEMDSAEASMLAVNDAMARVGSEVALPSAGREMDPQRVAKEAVWVEPPNM